MILLILCVALVMGVSFLCSLTEACLFSLSEADLARLSERKPYLAEVMRQLKENIQKPTAAILIINNLANIVGAALSGAVFASLFGSQWVGLFSFILALAIIQWAEYLPKTLGVLYKQPLAAVIALPLAYVTRVLKPLIFVLEWINSPFRGGHRRRVSTDTLGEIIMLTRFASINKLISREQVDIVARSIRLSQCKVQDIMVARNEIKHLSNSMSMAEALVAAHVHHHTRYPLIEGTDLNRTLGFVNFKDIVSALQLNPLDPSLKSIARPLLEIKASQSVTSLLKELTRGYQHMAVVKDDGGQTVGLVTLGDVIEEIVGELEDEYDSIPAYVYRIAADRFLVGGGISLAGLQEKTGFQLPLNSSSLNEWLGSLSGASPSNEMRIPYQDLLFTIRRMRRSKIHEVILEKNTAQPALNQRSAPAGQRAAEEVASER